MPDIFDQVAAEPGAPAGDIFDEVSSSGDIFDQASVRLEKRSSLVQQQDQARKEGTFQGSIRTGLESDVDLLTGLVGAGKRGIKNLQALPTVVAAAGTKDYDKPSIRHEKKAYDRAMRDPKYWQEIIDADGDREKLQRVESLLGPRAKLDTAMAPQREIQKAHAEALAEKQADIAAVPKSEAQQRLAAATNSSEKWAAWLKDPVELTAGIVLESLPASLVGAAVGGPAGSVAAGVGVSSAAMTFSNEFLSNAGALGYDVQDPDSLREFLNNSEDFEAAFNPAAVKASIVGQVDATTAGLAGKFMEPALRQGLKQILIAGAKEGGMQAAGGMAGEYVGTVAAGQKPDLFDVAMEGFAEIASAPGEIIANRKPQPAKVESAKAESEKPAAVPVTRDLAAELQASMRGNQVAEPVRSASPKAEDLLETVLADLPADTRAEIEERLQQERQEAEASEAPVIEPVSIDTATTPPVAERPQQETEADLQAQLDAEMEAEIETEKPAISAQDAVKQSVPSETDGPKATVTPQAAPVKPEPVELGLARGKLNAAQTRLSSLTSEGKGQSPFAFRLRGQIAKQKKIIARFEAGKPPRKQRAGSAGRTFDRETETNGPDILSWIASDMKMLSKSTAKKTWGERFAENKSDWDGAPMLARPHHNKIYSPTGSAPNQVAQAAYEAGQLDSPDVNELWDAINRASQGRAKSYERQRRMEKQLQAEVAEMEKANRPAVPENSELGGETRGEPLELKETPKAYQGRESDLEDISQDLYGKPYDELPEYDQGQVRATLDVEDRKDPTLQGREQPEKPARRDAGDSREQAGENAPAAEPASRVQPAAAKAQTREALAQEIYRQPYSNLSEEAQARVRQQIADGRTAGTKQPTSIDEKLFAMQDEIARLREDLFFAPRDANNSPTTSRGVGILAQIRHIEGQMDMLREIANAPAELKREWFRKFLEGDAPDAVERTLDRWIQWTSSGQGRLLEGVTGAPVWLTKGLLDGALRTIRAAYQGGKKLVEAIEAGVIWLRDQEIQGFDETAAREFLTTAARNANPVIARTPAGAPEGNQAEINRVVDELDEAQELAAKLKVRSEAVPEDLRKRIKTLEARLRELKNWKVPEDESGESQPKKTAAPRRRPPATEFGNRAPETKLKLSRLQEEWQTAVDQAKASGDWTRVRELNDQMNEIINASDPTGDRVNVDITRTAEETSELIAGTVDALNGALDTVSAYGARGDAVPEYLTQLINDLKTRLNLLKGWADDSTEATIAGKPDRKPVDVAPTDRQRQYELESATDPDRKTFAEFWDALKRGLRYFLSPIPELPVLGETARKAAVFVRGYRLFNAESNRVRADAGEKIQRVLEPLEKIGRTRQQNDALKTFQKLGQALQRARARQDDKAADAIAEKMGRIEKTGLANDPFTLFRKIVLYRDIWWRGTFLKTPDGKPITLPNGLSIDEVAMELRRLNAQLEAHANRAEITEALRRHYALTNELQQSIMDHGEIIPESLRNPLYFPHHILENWTGNMDHVRPSTEEDFRKYLIAPVGSGKLIQADYLKAMYLHVAEVMAHNARVDLVQKYWQAYDISEKLKEEHGENWDKPWVLPPGYKLFAPFKKLPLRMDYILSREVLADKLGVLFNDGDLRERMGEAGKVLKIAPEDLHAAMVAGEKIKWALPVEIADALEGIAKREAAKSNPGLGHAIGLPARKLVNFWKKTKLFAPWNWIRYEYGNTLTDVVDKVMVADPKVALYLKRSASEILRASWKGEKSEAFKAASREGVFDTITAAEAGELQKLREFTEFQSTDERAKSIVHRFLSATTGASRFREANFRYAKFLADVDRMKAGEEPVYAGAYHENIRALGEGVDGQLPLLKDDELMYAKAAEISLKTFGDYNSLSVISQWLRVYAIPFWSWQDVNFRYHANQLRNIADGLKGIRGGSARQVALKYAAVRVVTVLIGVGLAQELWNQFGGPLLGLWDDDDDLENKLSAHDRRRSHILLGKDRNGKAMVVYTPSALADVAEWIGGQNAKRLFVEYAKGDITLEQFVADYAKQLPADVVNKLAQSAGPIIKGPYETVSGKAVFPDVLDQRSIPKPERFWRLAGTMTDDRAVNWLRQVFDKDYYSQPANEQLQQIILQVRRRDPEQWAYYETREKAADWKEEKTGKRFEFGAYDAPEAQVLRNFRRAIYRADVPAAERFYERLLDYGYTAERLDASIRNQDPLSDLNKQERKEYLETLDARDKRLLELANQYYARLSVFDRRERQLFPTKYQVERGVKKAPNKELLQEIMAK
jgi:hypothetical protein